MGRTWRQTGRFPMCHARPFTAGGRLYRLGHRGNLGVCVSTNKGETWSEVGWLTKGRAGISPPATSGTQGGTPIS